MQVCKPSSTTTSALRRVGVDDEDPWFFCQCFGFQNQPQGPKVAPPRLPSGAIASIRTTSDDAEAGQEGVVVDTKGSSKFKTSLLAPGKL